MLKNILKLADGTILTSGSAGNAIVSLTVNSSVNSDTELTLGSAFADYIEAEIWAEPDGGLSITAGDELTLYQEDDSGTQTQVGIYIADKPTRSKRNSYKVTAYDRLTLLDKGLSDWLREQQSSFPMTLWAFAQATAAQCGVTLADESLPLNGDYEVQAFYADDLTGRQLLSWVAEAAGCYLHATAEGKIGFGWYEDASLDKAIGPDTTGREISVELAGENLYTSQDELFVIRADRIAYYMSSLSYEDYTVKGIEKVQIRQSDSDAGVIYPDDSTATNTYVVQGNLLLTTGSEAALKPVAQALYERLSAVTYTPFKASVKSGTGLRPGQIVSVTDARGNSFTTYLMSATVTAGKTTLESTGSVSRDSSSAVNSQSYKNLTGKMLEIQTSVDGLNVKASELSGNYASLALTLDSFKTEVSETYSTKTYADNAASDAESNAKADTAEKLESYSTTTEMTSAIDQKASEISLTVTQQETTLKTYADNAASDAKNAAIDDTDEKLKSYSTTTEMTSAIDQKANEISLTVSQQETTLKTYADDAAADAESNAKADTTEKLKSYSTTTQIISAIKLAVDALTLSVTNGSSSSTLQLKSGSTVLSSADIKITGVVTFEDLSGAGKSVINGANITTGTINSAKGNTAYDLDNGTIRMGPSDSTRIELAADGIRQYYQNYLTGVIRSQYAKTYIGCNSEYTFLGWFSDGYPQFEYTTGGSTNTFCGIAIAHTAGTIHCNATKFEIPGRIECTTLYVNGHQIT